MIETTDWDLLRRYTKGSNQAFVELTSRYLDYVFALAIREAGDRALAEDITQAVFLLLARKACSFNRNIVLASWLFHATRLTGRNTLRLERRRNATERRALEIAEEQQQEAHASVDTWARIEPFINDALAALREQERAVILLHFFQGRTFAEVGTTMRISEDAARMRSARALEKLRRNLVTVGTVAPAATLAALLSAHSARAAAPKGLLAQIAMHSSAGVQTNLLVQGALNAMKMMKLKAAVLIAAAVVAIPVAGTAVVKTTSAIIQERQQTQLLAELQNDPQALSVGEWWQKMGWISSVNDYLRLDVLIHQVGRTHAIPGDAYDFMFSTIRDPGRKGAGVVELYVCGIINYASQIPAARQGQVLAGLHPWLYVNNEPGDASVRYVTGRILLEKVDAKKSIPVVLTLLGDPNPEVRHRIATLLSQAGYQTPPAQQASAT